MQLMKVADYKEKKKNRMHIESKHILYFSYSDITNTIFV